MAQQKKTGRHASAKKEVRKSAKHRVYNHRIISSIKKLVKEMEEIIKNKDSAKAKELIKKVFSELDSAARLHIIHPSTCARKKSRLTIKINKL
ncbi:MAG: 30S ribosomal protein S20 [Elusimicrobiota bacterium]